MHTTGESDKIAEREVCRLRKNHIEKEWVQLQKAEQAFLNRNIPVRASGWQEKIARHVPQKLEETLNTAFFKAFEMMFDKGTGIIEKTYQREKKEQNYKINAYAADVRNTRWSLRAFGRDAAISKNINMAVSTVEGMGMGILGMGIPDIPVFLGVLLKSIYEIALSYGFSYDTEEEQIFILKLIETALSHEQELAEQNMELNLWMQGKKLGAARTQTGETQEASEEQADARRFEIPRSEQIKRTADALSKELLYLKFVQGLPVVGVVGGFSDMVYQKKISDYAALKYKRRFLAMRRDDSLGREG